MNDKDDTENPGQSSSLLEGGLFYPVGYIVLGLPEHAEAVGLHRLMVSNGLSEKECVLITAAAMVEAAGKDLESEGVLSSLGSTGHVRQRQLQLAQEGCHFLMVKASSEEEKQDILKQLTSVAVRYAVHYRRLVIEDLIAHIPSATADSESARKV